jgi:hypothetical protein
VVQADAQTADPGEYLNKVLRLMLDLWKMGSRLTARSRLSSALFFATKNGRSVSPVLEVRAATELAQMEAQDHQPRDAMNTLVNVQQVAQQLDDTARQKVVYYRLMSSVGLGAGYFPQGSAAALEAIRLLGPGHDREQVEAELTEATFLEGRQQPASTEDGTEA